MRFAWYIVRGFVIGVLSAPIYALLYVYDMTWTFPREWRMRNRVKTNNDANAALRKGGAK